MYQLNSSFRPHLLRFTATLLLSALIVACGDSGGATPTPPDSAPTVEILSPAPKATETGDVVTMTCTVSSDTESVSYRVNGGEPVAVEFSSDTYSFPLRGLAEGQNRVEVTVTSGSGAQTRSLLDIIWLPGSRLEARDDASATETQRTARISVLSNDRGRSIVLDSFTQPENGTVQEFTIGGVLEYDPDDGFVGADSFEYTIRDRDGTTDSATVSVNVVPRNEDAPTARDDSATTPANTRVGIDVLANDSDPDNDPLSIAQGSLEAQNGTVEFVYNGFENRVDAVSYTPNEGFTGTDRFSYFLSDSDGFNEGDGGDEATVTVTVSPAEND